MKPETKAKLDAARARLKAAQDRIAGKSAPESDAREIETLKRTVRDLEAKLLPAMTTGAVKAFTPKRESLDAHKIGIDANRFSLVKTLLAHDAVKRGRGAKAFEDFRAEYERDALDSYYAVVGAESGKTMTFGDEPSGGFLVPPEVRAPIDALRSATWMDKLPVQRYSGLTASPIMIPRQTADNTSYWVTEGTATTASDPTLDQIALNKRILANGTLLSLSLMRSAPAVAEQIARRSIAASMQRKMELGLIEGASGGPLGLTAVSGIGSVAFTSANGDTKQVKVNQMILELTQDNVPTEGAMWLLSEKVWANLVGVLYIGAGTAAPDRAASQKYTDFAYVDQQGQKWLAGYKVVTTNNLTVSTTGELWFGQWSEMIVADWGAAAMSMTTEGKTLALARQALISTFQEVDSNVTHPEAFCKGTAYTVALT